MNPRHSMKIKSLTLGAAIIVVAAACSSGATNTPLGSPSPASSASAAAPASAAASAGASIPTPAPRPASLPAKLVIGIAEESMGRSFTTALSQGAHEEAAKLGVDLRETDSKDDPLKQASDVQDLIAQGIQGLILSPVNGGASVAWVDQANKAGVPVVSVSNQVGAAQDRGPKDVYPGLVALVTQDELATSGGIGTYLAKTFGGPGKTVNIAVLEGANGVPATDLRNQGFKAALDASGISYKILSSQPGDWVQEKGESACQNMLAANPDLTVIYSMSDEMSIGCDRAIKAAQRSVPMVSMGGNAAGVALVTKGTILATDCYQPKELGVLAVRAIVSYLRGEKTYNHDFITYDTPVITKDNTATCPPTW